MISLRGMFNPQVRHKICPFYTPIWSHLTVCSNEELRKRDLKGEKITLPEFFLLSKRKVKLSALHSGIQNEVYSSWILLILAKVQHHPFHSMQSNM